MLVITEITNTAKRAAANDYLASHERCAATFAAQFPANAMVNLGPVRAGAHGTAFEVRDSLADNTVPAAREMNYSLLRGCPVRSLPVALAHEMARTCPHDPYLVTLLRLYLTLPVAQRAECRAELHTKGCP